MSQVLRTPRQLGALIERQRRQRQLTQMQLAALSGVRQEAISRIERGHDATRLATVIALFNALGLELFAEPQGARPAPRIEDVF